MSVRGVWYIEWRGDECERCEVEWRGGECERCVVEWRGDECERCVVYRVERG